MSKEARVVMTHDTCMCDVRYTLAIVIYIYMCVNTEQLKLLITHTSRFNIHTYKQAMIEVKQQSTRMFEYTQIMFMLDIHKRKQRRTSVWHHICGDHTVY